MLGLWAAAYLGACAASDATADGGLTDAGTAADAGTGPGDGGAPDCTGKACGAILSDNSRCFGPCDGVAAVCTGGPDWRCEAVTCTPACAGKTCGDDDGCGGKCAGSCADPAQYCDGQAFSCVDDPCAGKACGETADGLLCVGACAQPLEECKVDAADATKATCVPCNVSGAPAGGSCTDQGTCQCGTDCVKLFQDDAACPADPAQCQAAGLCLEDCFAKGACSDAAQICACVKADPTGACVTADCFATGTAKGNFSGKVLDSCTDQATADDVGAGNLTAELPGMSATFDQFIACRYTDATADLVLVQGFKKCGEQVCPDALLLGADAAALKAGTMQFQDGALVAEWDQYTFTGSGADAVVTGIWIRGLGVDGSLTFTQAGTGGKAAIAGTADLTLVKYDVESCGPSTTACK